MNSNSTVEKVDFLQKFLHQHLKAGAKSLLLQLFLFTNLISAETLKCTETRGIKA